MFKIAFLIVQLGKSHFFFGLSSIKINSLNEGFKKKKKNQLNAGFTETEHENSPVNRVHPTSQSANQRNEPM